MVQWFCFFFPSQKVRLHKQIWEDMQKKAYPPPIPGFCDSGVLVELLVLKRRGLPYIDLPSPFLRLHHQDCTSNKGKKCLFVCIPGVNSPPFGEIESERLDCKFCKTDIKLDWFRRRVPIYHDWNLFWTQHDVHIQCIRSSSGIGLRGPSWQFSKSVTGGAQIVLWNQ